MPNIPTYRSNRPKSTNLGQAPLNPSVANVAGQAVGQGFAAGARAEMRGLQQLGGSVSDFGAKLWQVEQRKNDLIDNNSSIEAKRIRERGALEQKMWETDNPHSTWEANAAKIAQRDAELVSQLEGTDQWRKRESLNSQYNTEISILTAKTRSVIQLDRESKILASDDLLKATSMYGADSDQYKDAMQKASVAFDDMSEEIRTAAIEEITENGTKVYNRNAISEAIQSGAFTSTTGEADKELIQKAINKITDKPDERSDLMRHALSEINLKNLMEANSSKNYAEQINSDAYNKFNSGDYAGAKKIIDESGLPIQGDGGKLEWYKLINSKIDAELRAEDAKTEQARIEAQREVDIIEDGDVIIAASIERGIDTGDNRWNPTTIWGMVAKGLGTKQASRLVTRWNGTQRGDESLTSPTAKDYLAKTESLYTNEYFGKKDDPEAAMVLLAFKARMREFIDSKGGNPTDAEMLKWWNGSLKATGYGSWKKNLTGAQILGIEE